MTRTPAVLAAVLALCAGGTAGAQNTIGSYAPPRVSPYTQSNFGFAPYLNLLNGGNLAVNYYGITLPEIQAGNAISQLRLQLAATQASIVAPPGTNVPLQTGHATRFMQYNQYFGTTGTTGTTGTGRQGFVTPPATFGRR
jgi:hypothetical protein